MTEMGVHVFLDVQDMSGEVVVIAEGLGFGQSTENAPISLKRRIESGELSNDRHAESVEFLVSPDASVEVRPDKLEDDCPDGRPSEEDLEESNLDNSDITPEISTNYRVRVFGGPVHAMAVSLLSVGAGESMDVDELIDASLQKLGDNNIELTAHTDDNGQEDKSGCGAFDGLPVILMNAIRYQGEIKNSIKQHLPDNMEFNEAIFESVIQNFVNLFEKKYFANYSGKDCIGKIKNKKGSKTNVRVGKHKEGSYVLNWRRNTTLNHKKWIKKFGKDEDVFWEDAWRCEDYALIAASDFPAEEKEVVAMQAFYGQLIEAFAIPSTLTDGSLTFINRTEVIKEAL